MEDRLTVFSVPDCMAHEFNNPTYPYGIGLSCDILNLWIEGVISVFYRSIYPTTHHQSCRDSGEKYGQTVKRRILQSALFHIRVK